MGQATSRMEMAEGTEHKVQVRGLDRDLDRDQSVETVECDTARLQATAFDVTCLQFADVQP